MNCAKCYRTDRSGRQPATLRLATQVKLLKVGVVGDHYKYQCPQCRAIFFFPMAPQESQVTFNSALIPA